MQDSDRVWRERGLRGPSWAAMKAPGQFHSQADPGHEGPAHKLASVPLFDKSTDVFFVCGACPGRGTS